MRWKVKPYKKESNWRIKTRFAFLPVRTSLPNRNTMIWLEFYQTNDHCTYAPTFGPVWSTTQTAPMGYWNKE